MRVYFYLMMVYLLGACAMVPEKSLVNYHLTDMRHLKEINKWFFNGRLAVLDGKSSNTISIAWRHAVNQDNIELSGPLGQGKILVLVADDQVTVDDGETKQSYSGNSEAIISELLGVNVPFDALKWWVLGIDDPSLPVIEQESGFQQNDWQIRYTELQWINAEHLPKKVMASKDAVKIKLVIDQWEF